MLIYFFSRTFTISHEADLALKASQRYKEIIDLLNESRKTAREADNIINDGNKKIHPKGKSSLMDDALVALDISEAINEDAEILGARVEGSIFILSSF